MKNVIIFGAAARGSRLKRRLDQAHGYKVCYFCDNDPKKWKESLNGIEIISVDALKGLVRDGFTGILIVAVREHHKVIEEIQSRGGIDLQVYGVMWGYMDQKKDMDAVLYQIDMGRPYLDYLEYHIADHCDLKCRGCGHYSNIADPRFGDLEKYIRDLKRLKELFWGVRTMRLMGGEPLLNTSLPEFISASREMFPDADIMVVTNGLLIPHIRENVFAAMNKYCVRFDISSYPPTLDIKQKIELRCIETDVRYRFSQPVHEFYDCMNLRGDSDKDKAYQKCASRGCHFLEDGKIAVCGMPILYKRQQAKLPWKIDVGEQDIVDLYDQNLDGEGLKMRLSRPMEVCRFCSDTEMERFQWQGEYPYCEKGSGQEV